ncbi:MAG: FKBP-type peptidyl-prolyl cis-trans isomerase [Actinobacteria bacterium]|nr:FKBP-type peptidyl-prolyl cis-trans isomerase [Actinomycetota bacterium]
MSNLRGMKIVVASVLCCLLVGACGSEDSADTAGQEPFCPEGSEQLAEQLCFEDVEVGDGAEAKSGDTVTVHYTGTLEDGTEFDSSVGGDPFIFTLGSGGVIEGWEQGVPGMRAGGTRKLTIGPDLAYGDSGAGDVIPPDATLIFEIELLEVTPAS